MTAAAPEPAPDVADEVEEVEVAAPAAFTEAPLEESGGGGPASPDTGGARPLAAAPVDGSEEPSDVAGRAPHGDPARGSRSAYFGPDLGLLDTPVRGRFAVPLEPVPGPMIIEEYEGTAVVPPDATVRREEGGNLVIELGGGS